VEAVVSTVVGVGLPRQGGGGGGFHSAGGGAYRGGAPSGPRGPSVGELPQRWPWWRIRGGPRRSGQEFLRRIQCIARHEPGKPRV